jgi:alpha-ribazole phosphatase
MRELTGRHRGEGVIVVAHGGPIRAMLASVLEMPDHAVFRIGVALASVSVVEWTGDEPVVLGLSHDSAVGPAWIH